MCERECGRRVRRYSGGAIGRGHVQFPWIALALQIAAAPTPGSFIEGRIGDPVFLDTGLVN